MIRFDDVALRRGPRVLFSGADFTLFRGEKVGITGENGSGKSSLLAMVRGELTPDAGHVGLPPGLEIAHVAQDVEASAQPAIDFVMDGDAALRLLEAPRGPVLEDFPEDAPGDTGDAATFVCPVSFGNADDGDSLMARVEREMAELLTWSELARQKRGRSTVGVSGLPALEAARWIDALVRDPETPVYRQGLERLPALRLARTAIEEATGMPVAVVRSGGAIPLVTALAKKGIKAALIEKGNIAGEQSSRNWGWCRQQHRDQILVIRIMRRQPGREGRRPQHQRHQRGNAQPQPQPVP